MKRRGFLQSLIAGGAALTLPVSMRTVHASPRPDLLAVQILEQEYVLSKRDALTILWTRIDVPPTGVVRIMMRPEDEKSSHVIPSVIMVPVDPNRIELDGDKDIRIPGRILIQFPNIMPMAFPHIDAYALSDIDVYLGCPIDHPIVTYERPFVFEARSATGEPGILLAAVHHQNVPKVPECEYNVQR